MMVRMTMTTYSTVHGVVFRRFRKRGEVEANWITLLKSRCIIRYNPAHDHERPYAARVRALCNYELQWSYDVVG